MRVILKTKNIKITRKLTEYINKKIEHLERFVVPLHDKKGPQKKKTLNEIRLELERTTQHHKKGVIFRVEAQMRLPGKIVDAEAVTDDIFVALDEVKDELQRQVKQYRKKKMSQSKRQARLIKRLMYLSPLAQFKRWKGRRDRQEGI